MTTGMLWYDPDRGTDLASKVQRAASHYRAKYGAEPDLCFLHPSTAEGETPSQLGPIRLQTHRAVLPGHLWLGVAAARASSV
ncbi:MAG: hypothetical protein MUO23_01250 [Anaerolineales bacterium]|nr:hypothetical protein [Anaerolineales bacterium]